ncbi:hypothetical protein Tco_0421090 [Tanacetum coccineum]
MATLNESSPQSHDPPLLEGNTSGSGEDSMEHQVDLTDFVSPIPYDSPFSGGHTPGSDEDCSRLGDPKAKKESQKIGKGPKARTLGMKLFKIGTSRRKGLYKENVSNQGRKSDKTKPMFNDSNFDVLDDAMENVEGGSTAEQITTTRDTLNTDSINVSAAGPSHVSTVGPSNVSAAGPSTSTAGDIFEDEMVTIADTLVAIRSTRPRTASVVIHDVEEEPRRATPVPTVQSQDKGKEQSAEKEKELSEEELQKLLVVVPVEEVYVEALQVKYPIIDWEVYSEDTRRYWKIIRVGNHTEAYQIFAEMLKKFDRDDLVKLWDLVKERFSTTEPTDDKEKELWVELKRLFEPDNDDILWKLQRYMHDPLVWRLYDTCGVHHVSSVRGHDIFMLVEKDYPLSKGVLMLMLVNKLLVEADSEMSRELLRKIFIQANRSRQ